MKIKFGAIVVDGHGKIGGHVAAKNRGGNYLRTKVTPVNPRTSYQSAVRARLSGISQAWRGLAVTSRQAWNSAISDYSKTNIFGDIKNPSGFNLYQMLNNNLLNIGSSVINEPSVPIAIPSLTSLVLSGVAETSLSLAFAETPTPSDMALVIRATAPLSAGVTFAKSEFRQISHITAATVSPTIITTAYTAKFGAVPAADRKIFIEAFYISTVTGQKGASLQTSLLMT